MKKIFLLTITFLLLLFSKYFVSTRVGWFSWDDQAYATMALGAMLLIAYFSGEFVCLLKLPKITGYILVGIILGPHIVSLFDPYYVVLTNGEHGATGQLQLIDHLALGLIALTAGGEMKLDTIRSHWKSLSVITLVQVAAVFLGITGLFILLQNFIPLFSGATWPVVISISLLIGIVSTANSPATTIAIINECQSKGPMTDVSLGVTVIKDVIVISLFSLVLACAKLLVVPGQVADATFLKLLAFEVFGSIGIGMFLGFAIAVYIDRFNKELPLLVLGVAFLSVYMSTEIHLSGLLICMVAGFFVENFSKHGDSLIHAIEKHSLVVYIIFFTITGAQLDLPSLWGILPLTLMLVAARAIFTMVGTRKAAAKTNTSPEVQQYAWLAFIAQAGVTLGLAVIIEKTFAEVILPNGESMGAQLKTLIIGAVAVNQIIGPIAFRYGLSKSGEIPIEKPAATEEVLNLES